MQQTGQRRLIRRLWKRSTDKSHFGSEIGQNNTILLLAGGHYRHCHRRNIPTARRPYRPILFLKIRHFIFFFYVTLSQNKISTNRNNDKIITVICKNQQCRRKLKFLQEVWHFNDLQLPSLLTLRLLMSYICGATSKARNANVVYIWTYVWQRWNSLFLFATQCFNTESMQRGFLCHICV